MAKFFPFARAKATLPSVASTANSPVTAGGIAGNVTSLLSIMQGSTALTIPTESAVYGLPAAWYCLNLISHNVALMLSAADCYTGDDKPTETHPLVKLPNPIYNGSYEFWSEAISTILMHGNAIFVKNEYDDTGNATEVIPVHPLSVECRLSANGPLYKIHDSYYSRDEIIHVRGFTTVGQWWGLGVVEVMRNQLTGSINMQAMANDVYKSASVPSGAIKLLGKPSQEIMDKIKQDWLLAFGSGQRTPVVLPEGMDFAPLSWTPEDQQFLEAQNMDIAKTMLMFGMNPADISTSFINGGTTQNYANVQDRNLDRLRDAFGPWLMRFEQAWSKALPDDTYVKGNPEALLRTNTKARYEAHKIALDMGLYDEAYAQDLENIPADHRPEKKPEPVMPQLPQAAPVTDPKAAA